MLQVMPRREPRRRGRAEAEVAQRAAPSALASPASLKGVLRPRDAAAALAAGCGAAGVEGGAAGRRRRRGDGSTCSRAALGGEWRRGDAFGPAGGPAARSVLLPDGTRRRGGGGDRLAARAGRAGPARARRAAGSASCSPRSRAPARCSSARRHGDRGRRRRAARRCSSAGRRRLRVACDVATPLYDAARRASSGPRRARRPSEVEELERRLRGDGRSSRLRATCRARARRAGSARRSRRSAPSSSRAPRACSTSSASTRAGADLVVTGEGSVDATTLEGKAPGEVVRRCRGRRPCVVFGGLVEAPPSRRRDLALSGDPGRARGRPRRARPPARDAPARRAALAPRPCPAPRRASPRQSA